VSILPRGRYNQQIDTDFAIGTKERGATAYRRCPSFFLLDFFHIAPGDSSSQSLSCAQHPAEVQDWLIDA